MDRRPGDRVATTNAGAAGDGSRFDPLPCGGCGANLKQCMHAPPCCGNCRHGRGL